MRSLLPLAQVGLLLGLLESVDRTINATAQRLDRSVVTSGAPEHRFKFIVPDYTTPLELTLTQHAVDGYRLLSSSAGGVLFEKVPGAAASPEYLVVRTQDRPTFQRRLNETASRSFRLIPHTLSASGTTSTIELQAVMEKASTDAAPRFEYRIVERPSKRWTRVRTQLAVFSRELGAVVRAGWRAVCVERIQRIDRDGAAEGDPEHFVVLERPSGDRSTAVDDAASNARFELAEPGASKLQQHLDDLTGRGYRILDVQAEPLVLLERAHQPDEPVAYLVVRPTNAGRTLQREMNAAATRGYRLRPHSLFDARTRGMFWKPSVGLIMEKRGTSGPQPEYLVIDAYRLSTFTNEVAEAFARGFEPVDLAGTAAARYMFLQRPAVAARD